MGTLANLGYINKAAYYPCSHPDPVLILQAAGHAIGPTLMGALSFGCNDILKMRAGLSPWHHRGITALIKGAIPPAQSDPINKIWKYFIPLEKTLFFFFVVDLTTGFLANWQSQIFKLGACGATADVCHWSGNNQVSVCVGNDIWAPLSYNTTNTTGTCFGVGGSGFAVPRNKYWSAYFTCTPKPIINGQVVSHVLTRLHRLTPTAFSYTPNETFPPWTFNPVQGMYMISGQNKTNGTATYRFEFATNVASITIGGSAAITTSDFPIYNGNIIPLNCFGLPAPSAGNTTA